MAENLTALPTSFTGGTTIEYSKSVSDYPASDGWTLTLYLAGVDVKEIEAEADGDAYVVTIAASVTAAPFRAGVYEYLERVEKAGVVHEVSSGMVEITPNIAEAAAGDRQSYLERSIIVLRQYIEHQLEAGNQSYAIAGRAVTKIPIAEAIKILHSYEAELAHQKNPTSLTRSVLVRFTGTGVDR